VHFISQVRHPEGEEFLVTIIESNTLRYKFRNFGMMEISKNYRIIENIKSSSMIGVNSRLRCCRKRISYSFIVLLAARSSGSQID
jgi:hypothetical protein